MLRYILKHKESLSVNKIHQSVAIIDYWVSKSILSLLEADFLEKEGNGPSTKYTIASDSVERLTQIQIKMEQVKKEVVNNV